MLRDAPFILSNRVSAQGRLGRLALKAVLVLLAAAWVASAYGQAPPVLWSTNIGARLFAVDEQTNVYANVAGTVIKLGGDGVPVQTNAICPLPGIAQRDAAGNFYFAGSYTPPQDFGGVMLTNGYCFAAKYSPTGSVIWARVFGPGHATGWNVNDLRVEANGNGYVGYHYSFSAGLSEYVVVDALDPTGGSPWQTVLVSDSFGRILGGSVRLGVATSSNVCALVFTTSGGYPYSTTGILRRLGADSQAFGNASQADGGSATTAARPIQNALRELFAVEGGVLTKRTYTGDLIWTTNLDNWLRGPLVKISLMACMSRMAAALSAALILMETKSGV